MPTTTEVIRQDKFKRPVVPHIFDLIKLIQQTEEPDNPEDGWIAYADGTSWNPGSGEGIYAYYNATWNKL